jgi:hypothetical protein
MATERGKGANVLRITPGTLYKEETQETIPCEAAVCGECGGMSFAVLAVHGTVTELHIRCDGCREMYVIGPVTTGQQP